MFTVKIPCAVASSQDCRKEIEQELPVPNLTPCQCEQISLYGEADVVAIQVDRGDASKMNLSAEQRLMLHEFGEVRMQFPTATTVCPACDWRNN